MKNFLISTAVLMLMVTTASAHQDHKEQAELTNHVLMVELEYNNGRWAAKPTEVAPCEGPGGPPLTRSDKSSMLQLLDRNGRIIYQRYLRNPRWVHYEATRKDGKKPDILLEQLKLKLAVPIEFPQNRNTKTAMPSRLTFTETVGSANKPSLSINIARQVNRLYRASKSKKDFACQLEVVTAEHLPPLRMGSTDSDVFAKSDNLKNMIMAQPDLALRVISDTGVGPAKFRKAIYDLKGQWAAWGLDKAEADRLIREYGQIFRKKKGG